MLCSMLTMAIQDLVCDPHYKDEETEAYRGSLMSPILQD